MCGETFSSKFSPDQKAAAAKAHPLARPGRWSVGYTHDPSTKDDPRTFHSHERAYFDYDGAPASTLARGGSRKGFATRAEAEAAIEKFQPRSDGWFVIPPLEESGDHRIRTALSSGAVTTDDLADFVDAVLNNRQAQFEPLRERFAAASLVAPAEPPAPKLTRAEAAQKLVAALVPVGLASAERWLEGYGSGPGNAVTVDDFSDKDSEQDGELVYDEDGDDAGDRVYYAFDPDQSRAIHAAVKAYFEAEDAEPEQRWGLFSVPGDGREPGSLFHGYATVLTRREAEAAQKKHGGRIARIVRDDAAKDGWREKL